MGALISVQLRQRSHPIFFAGGAKLFAKDLTRTFLV
jgi:hypothetical protein